MTRGEILNRPMDRRWLDAALRAARETSDPIRRRDLLHDVLLDANLGKEALIKTVRMLRKIWWEPPTNASGMIQWAWKVDDPVDTRVLHIGAMLAAFPFIGDVYAAVGTILRQSDVITNSEVVRRVVATWGDRESVRRAAVMALNTLKSLDVLSGDRNSAEKRLSEVIPVPQVLQVWITHALLLTRSVDSVDITSIRSAPELFGLHLDNQNSRRAYPMIETFSEGDGRVVLAERR